MSIFSAAQITFEEVYSKLLGSGNLLDNKLLETYQSSLLQSSRKIIAIFSVAVSSGDYSNLFGSKPFGIKPSVAYLSVANLSVANLSVAYLSVANLSVAYLSTDYSNLLDTPGTISLCVH